MKRLPFRLTSFAQSTLSHVGWVRHWLFNLAAGVSLLLCAAIMIMCVRSYFYSDYLSYKEGPGHSKIISSGKGLIAFSNQQYYGPSTFENTQLISWRSSRPASYPVFGTARHWWERLGFWSFGIAQSTMELHRWVVPFWLPLMMTLILPIWAAIQILWARRQRFRKEHGLCPACGYDLRATPDRCPECGTVPVAAKGAPT